MVTKCNWLKMEAEDGKLRETDAADVETILRLIQSVPSPKAEPFKLWLARVGYERIEELSDSEKALNRSRTYWQRMGRSQKWIQQRMMGWVYIHLSYFHLSYKNVVLIVWARILTIKELEPFARIVPRKNLEYNPL